MMDLNASIARIGRPFDNVAIVIVREHFGELIQEFGDGSSREEGCGRGCGGVGIDDSAVERQEWVGADCAVGWIC